MPINSVAGVPTTRGGKLARAARMWWTPEQGGLRPEFREVKDTDFEVLVDQGGEYIGVGIERSVAGSDQFVRFDIAGKVFFIGPRTARSIAAKLRFYADKIGGVE